MWSYVYCALYKTLECSPGTLLCIEPYTLAAGHVPMPSGKSSSVQSFHCPYAATHL